MVRLQTFGWNLGSKISLYVKCSHFFMRYKIKKHIRRGKFSIVIMDVGVECCRGEESIMWELELVQQCHSLSDFTELGELVLGVETGVWGWGWLCFVTLEKLWVMEEDVTMEEEIVVGYLWKSPDPSKVFTFSWIPLLDRIPTHLNLAKMGVVEVETSTNLIFCGNVEESTIHLFLHFEISFNNNVKDIDELVDSIKVLCCYWSLLFVDDSICIMSSIGIQRNACLRSMFFFSFCGM